MLGVADDGGINRLAGIKPALFALFKAQEGPFDALCSQITRHCGFQLFNGDGGAEAFQRRGGNQMTWQENAGLNAFKRGRGARQRAKHIEERIGGKAPHDAVVQRQGIGAEQGLGPQCGESEQAIVQNGGVFWQKRGQKKRIGPDNETCRQAKHGTARIGPAPEQPAQKGRHELCDRRK